MRYVIFLECLRPDFGVLYTMCFMGFGVNLLVLMTKLWAGWGEQELYGSDGMCGRGGSA